jgi:hypothetical protein
LDDLEPGAYVHAQFELRLGSASWKALAYGVATRSLAARGLDAALHRLADPLMARRACLVAALGLTAQGEEVPTWLQEALLSAIGMDDDATGVSARLVWWLVSKPSLDGAGPIAKWLSSGTGPERRDAAVFIAIMHRMGRPASALVLADARRTIGEIGEAGGISPELATAALAWLTK